MRRVGSVMCAGDAMSSGAVALIADFAAMDFGGPFRAIADWIAAQWAIIASGITSARQTIDPIVWLVGSIAALVPGSFAIYQWLYYRRSRLPQRFKEMLEVEEVRLKKARQALLERIQRPESVKPFTAPIFVVPSMAKAMRKLKWVGSMNGNALPVADVNLQSALDEIQQRMQWCDDQRSSHKRQQATAYLLKGAIAAARADKERTAGQDAVARDREALGCFQKALETDSHDIEALEYVAHQHRILGEIDNAISSYQTLADQTDGPEPGKALVRMRALRYLGEMFERKFDAARVQLNLNTAKNHLTAALNIMPEVARDTLLEAFTHRWLGSVEDKKGTARLWQQEFDAADRIFAGLISRHKDMAEAQAGLEEVKQLRAAAINRRKDGAAPTPIPTESSALSPAT